MAHQEGKQKDGKKKKSFLENKDAALDLAKLVAEVQEDKSHQRVEKHHQRVEAQASQKGKKAPSEHRSRDKLRQVKAALAAKAAKAKRDRTKARKEKKVGSSRLGSKTEADTTSHTGSELTSKSVKGAVSSKPARKRVSFA